MSKQEKKRTEEEKVLKKSKPLEGKCEREELDASDGLPNWEMPKQATGGLW